MVEKPEQPSKPIYRGLVIALSVVAVAMAVYQLIYIPLILQEAIAHRITHLGFALVVIFLSLLLGSKRGWLLKWSCLIASVVVTIYLVYYLEDIMLYRSITPSPIDIIIAGLAIALCFIGTYLVWGKTFPILAVCSVAYLYFGRYLPFPFTVAPVPAIVFVVWLGIPGVEDGVYGSVMGISANFLFLFIFFGAMLYAFGGLRFIIVLAQWLGGKLRSGPAAVAVIGSSLLGMITGSTSANITITGAFTIPMMKKAGYTPEQAGAIESSASNGGQIMPPIMGSTAFVMSGYTGIPYINIVAAAILPALVYFFGLYLYVEITARKMVVSHIGVAINRRELLLDSPLFFVPLAVLVILLVEGFTLPFVGFWSIMSLIVVGLISSIRKEARLSFKGVLEDITNGVRLGSQIAVMIGLLGVIATAIKVSGLGVKLPLIIQDISGGHLIVALLIGMVASIILGMGVPSIVAYLLVAIGLCPALVKMGVPLLHAHLFTFIFAVFAHLTPPVAIGPLIASRIAGGEYWKTAWEGLKVAFTAFLLPYFIIYAPILTFRPESEPMLSIAQMGAILLSVLSMQMGISGYCFGKLGWYARSSFIIAALLYISFVFTQGQTYLYLFAGLALFAVTTAWQLSQKRQGKATPGLNESG